MSKTLAIFGAGPVLGLSLARRFGREGFRVAFVARTKENLDELVAKAEADGIEAAGFTADVYDRGQLAAAVAAITEKFGGIDVVEFSPGGGNMGEGIVPVLDADPENVQQMFDRFTLSAVALVNATLPAMIERGDGGILFTAGQSSVYPTARMGNNGMALAAVRNYYLNLNAAVADKGVYVGAVNIGALIEGSVPHQFVMGMKDLPHKPESIHPDTLAENFWELYSKRDKAEILAGSFGR
jgi:NADP-dependent 3-hydroxy acid dehydrogenase YdfG